MEEKVRKIAEREPVHVLTGPLYERTMPQRPNADEPHRIPSGYWKVVAVDKGQDAQGNPDVKMTGFIFDQETPKSANIMDHVVSVDEIERRSRYDLFKELPDSVENRLEGQIHQAWNQRHFGENSGSLLNWIA